MEKNRDSKDKKESEKANDKLIPIEIKSFKDLNLDLESLNKKEGTNKSKENKEKSNGNTDMNINDIIQSHKNKKESERVKSTKEKFTKKTLVNEKDEVNYFL